VHSLHAIVAGSPNEQLEWVKTLEGTDAVIVAIPDGDISKCLAETKLVSGWFVRPGILEMTLTRGSRLLAEKLLRPFIGIVIQPSESKTAWAIYSAAKVTTEMLQKAGLKRPQPSGANP
jgi:hypothetical protein